jgi:hypothetical protein
MFDKPYQSWLFLDEDDAGQDAVFIHIPNPNKDNFTLKIEKLNWESNMLSLLLCFSFYWLVG